MKIKKYFNPLNYLRLLVRIFYSLLYFVYLEKNIDRKLLMLLKDIHKGKRCFVIGNGPSLKARDLDKLIDEYTFASNKIYLIFDETKWRPTYYAVEDHLVAKQNYKKINELTGFMKFFPEEMLRRIGKSFKDSITFRFFYADASSDGFPGFSNDATNGLYWGSTIVYSQIQLAVHMGFREIYLIGVDFDYTVPAKKQGSNRLISEGEVNHFHKDYRKPGEKWHIPNLDVHVKTFNRAKSETDKLGVKIYNATRGGKLEIFSRVDFDKLF